MTTETRRTIYIGAVAAGATALVAAIAITSPLQELGSSWWLVVIMAALIALAGRFPFKISPQGDASMFAVPLFMSVVLLPPLGVVIAGTLGSLISERLLKAPAKVMAFNIGHTAIIGGLASIVFQLLRGDATDLSLAPDLAVAALVAGFVQNIVSLFLLGGLITVIKGRAFWGIWKDTWTVDTLQEGALIALGLVAALITYQAMWGMILLLIPFTLGYFGFKKSVEQARAKAELVEELQDKLKQLKEAQAQLVQSARLASVGTLAAGVAHEINNPTFAITGKAEVFRLMLKQQKDEYLHSTKAVEDIDSIVREGMRISTIVKHLLSYASRSDDVAEIRLDEVIHGAANLLKGKLAQKDVRLDISIEVVPVVEGVANQLEQVFMNLLSNSLDVTPQHSSIELGCTVEDGVAVAYVRDKGAGIPADVMEKIFEPFFTTKGIGHGMGLGLFICHKIVADHKGELSVESEHGSGTTFWVKLPAIAISRNVGEGSAALPRVS